jgi:BirA family biotin operon repressor/biotin-[acetyl-CoA-carboxylase] ligase
LLPGTKIARTALAANVLDRLLPALVQFEADGLAPFLPRWRELDALADHAVRVLDGANTHEGMALGVDASGALRVRMTGGERQFHSGEVSLRAL